MKKAFFIAASFLAMTACASHKTAVPLHESIDLGQSNQNIDEAAIKNVSLDQYWRAFDDAELNALIDLGQKQNLDLNQSVKRVKEARAIFDVSNYALGPNGSLATNANLMRRSEDGALPISRFPGVERDILDFNFGYDLGWEIDVFGGLHHAIDAAGARIDMLVYENLGIRAMVASEISRTYFELRGTQRELIAVNEYLANLDETIKLLNLRVSKGDLSHKELDELKAKREAYETQIPILNSKAKSASFALALLVGQTPETMAYLLKQSPNAPKLFAPPIGARSEILLRRPDILAADIKLKGRASETKYYESEKYPKFVMNAHFGWEALKIDDLFKTPSQAINIIPGIKWNIFDSGKINAQINASNAREEQALIEYKKAIMTALFESERATNEYEGALKALKEREDVTNAQTHLLNHQKMRFKLGDASKFEVLDAQRNVIDTQIQNIKTETQGAQSLISLLKAMGGGWEKPVENK